MKIRLNCKRILLFSLTVLLFLYFLRPLHYSWNYNAVVTGIVFTDIVIYFKNWTKRNGSYLDFEPIFVIFTILMGFVFPLFVYPLGDFTVAAFSFGKGYDVNNINRGTALIAIGLLAFLIGSYGERRGQNSIRDGSKLGYINNMPAFCIMLLFFFLYLLVDGFSVYASAYAGEAIAKNGSTYLEGFFVPASQVVVLNEFWNKSRNQQYKINLLYLSVAFLISLLFLIAGNRTLGSFIALPAIVLLSKFYYKLSLSKFFLFIVVAIVLMVIVQHNRSGSEIETGAAWYSFLNDFLIANSNTYLSCEIVDASGITWGKSFVQVLLSIIPMGQSVFLFLTDWKLSELSSAIIFSDFIGLEYGLGIGSNYIADSYLAFGLIGTVLLPYLLGRLLDKAKKEAFTSYRYTIVYYIICSFAVYLVRCAIFYPLKFIFWALIIAEINCMFNRKHRVNLNGKVFKG